MIAVAASFRQDFGPQNQVFVCQEQKDDSSSKVPQPINKEFA